MTIQRRSRGGALGYAQIGDLVRARVARGELQAGDRLTPVRELAAELGVNVNTVARAYADLAREGVVVAHAGGGTHVATQPAGTGYLQVREARLREMLGGPILQALGLGYRAEQIEATVVTLLGRWRVDQTPALRVPLPQETVILAGSHDLTLDLLAARLRLRQPAVQVDARYGGSLEGLIALARDEAHLAGCHLLDEQSGDYNAPFVSRVLPGREIALVTLALREQGLLTRPGNPKGLRACADLGRADLTVAVRQRGSGTQVLLEHELRRSGVPIGQIQSGDREYETHLALAAAIAGGAADVGLGIRGAARAFGLEFIAVATERYELAIPAHRLEEPGIRAVLDILGQDDFLNAARELGGYDVSETGRQRMVHTPEGKVP